MLLHMLRHVRLQGKWNSTQEPSFTTVFSVPNKQPMKEPTVEAVIQDSFISVGELFDKFKLDARAQVRIQVLALAFALSSKVFGFETCFLCRVG